MSNNNNNPNPENFLQMLDESLEKLELRTGKMVKAQVLKVTKDRVIVSAGLKSEDHIPLSEFRHEEVLPGDEIDVVVVTVDNGLGETRLSREKARKIRVWLDLEESFEKGELVTGLITERVKGGFTVEIDTVKAFLPGSLIDVKPVRDTSYLEGNEFEFKIIKMDQKRNNIVVSRRAVLQQEVGSESNSRMEELQEGQEITGVVKNITDYGAFVDLGGIDGLLHITDMSWKRIKHPSEVLKVGDEVRVKILKFDREKNRVSLGIKQLGEDPWLNVSRRYQVGERHFGVVSNITDYGCFVQLEEGIEGLVHMSEMDWTNKNVHPSKVVNSADEIEVVIMEVDEERRRISLGIKQCKPNPWMDFAEHHQVDQKIKGTIRSITDFGIFIGLGAGIDGLVHLSDISWSESGEVAIRHYKKGEEVEAIILAIDPERERISLGLKQLQSDPVAQFLAQHDKNAVIQAVVVELEPKQALLKLADNVFGQMRVSEYLYERVEDLRDELKIDQEIAVKIIDVDARNRQIQLSHKVLSAKAEKTAVSPQKTDTSKTTLGDLLKEQMKPKENVEDKKS